MMTALSKLLSGLLGSYASTLTIPLLVLGSLILGHQWVQAHNARLKAEATNVCDAKWETSIRRQERDGARAEAQAARAILEGERMINEGLNNDLARIAAENEELRRTAAAPADDPARCLSDSVLRSVGGSGQDVHGGAGSRSRGRGKD